MIVVGHRGARWEAPENTLSGFAYAARVGVAWVEYDVRLSADDQVVVIHDATVDRTTDGTGAVAEITLAELTALDARAQFTDWPEQCRIPTFAQVLAATADFEMAEIEIKPDLPERMQRLVPMVVAEIAEQGAGARVMLTSFNHTALRIAAEVAPQIPRTLIGRWDSPEWVQTAGRLGCVQADMQQHSVSSVEIVQAAKAAGLRVLGWPCNRPVGYDKLVRWGVDAITTDFPARILAHAAAAAA